ncbi:undecaprenyldiphospho-muramoylpentapeptide beta-N- acetylglucosaminyltransferase [bacterium BMS3Bbin14]|nr:undecaprenyldiphospho-muramoylpentapeptide beta-N- acetylglucosaminyltransferase [bacterium BMS3Bbin14]HDO30665.1 glycosyl transferase [Desulfobacteraceae bacterium]
MNIIIYCQHVLGIGHLFRTLAIAEALAGHRVTLVLGGPPVAVAVPGHVRVVRLPGLMMDAEFSRLLPVEPGRAVAEIKKERQILLADLVRDIRPELLLVELYPFGRSGFNFELGPLLHAVRDGRLPSCRVICSLRDILVEKKNQQKYEQRVLDRLNPFFDAVLVHGDPEVIKLDATFSRRREITVPVVYTGYICQKPQPGDRQAIRARLQLGPEDQLIVVSAGGGSVGHRLLESALRAHALMPARARRMQVFTGPYLDDHLFAALPRLAAPGATVERFTDNFPAWLAAADLSVSMGGYNTSMNVVAAGTPALVLPFGQNREQRLRAERLAGLADLSVLDESDLEPAVLAGKMAGMSGRREERRPAIRLEGARQTADWLSQCTDAGS